MYYEPCSIAATLAAQNGLAQPKNVKNDFFRLSEGAPLELINLIPNQTDYSLSIWAMNSLKVISKGLPLYIFGGAGTGKSALVRYIASTFRLPLIEVNGFEQLTSQDLLGCYTLVNGSTKWLDGPLTSMARNGGLFLLNEISLLSPATATGLNTLLDGAKLTLPETGESFTVSPYFRFIATDNTNGSGDMTGLFSGTLSQNKALISRFCQVKAEYLPQNKEQELLQTKCPALNEETCRLMIQLASQLRLAADSGADNPLLDVMTPRDILKWGALLELFSSSKAMKNCILETFNMAYALRLSEGDSLIAKELFHSVFGD